MHPLRSNSKRGGVHRKNRVRARYKIEPDVDVRSLANVPMARDFDCCAYSRQDSGPQFPQARRSNAPRPPAAQVT
jgi:hypothetical protein